MKVRLIHVLSLILVLPISALLLSGQQEGRAYGDRARSTVARVAVQPMGRKCPDEAAQPPAQAVSSNDFVKLERTSCFGACPVYTVKIHADGRVVWQRKLGAQLESPLFIALVLPVATLIPAAGDQCAVCGVQIQPDSRHFRTQGGGETYCERCFLSAPRCPRCKLPTAPEAIDPVSGLCSRCLAKLPRCTACGRVITGTAYTIRFAAGQFCTECKQSQPACYVCGVPVGNDHWKFPDGRHVCNQCGERAVIDVAEIRRIMLDAEQTIQRRLGLVISEPYELRVDKLADFRASHNGPGSSETPSRELYGRELGMYRRIEGKSEIVLLFGLPPELTYEAAAHEYAHAWAAENCRPDLPPDLREGFAQWVAADVLRSKGFLGALEKLEARTDSPYGTGYRRLRSMQRARLWAAIRKEE